MSKTSFKINDLYALPDRHVQPWHESWSAIVRNAFGMTRPEIVVEREVEQAARIRVHLKMAVSTEDDDTGDELYFTRIYVLSLDGTPYGAFVGSGGRHSRGGRTEFFVTDWSLYRSAIRIAEQFRKNPPKVRFVDEEFDLAAGADLKGESMQVDIDEYETIGRCFIVKRSDGFRLVEASQADGDGTLLFDNSVFFRALIPSPMAWGNVKTRSRTDAEVGRILSEVAAVIADAIPEGVRRVVANEPLSRLRQPWPAPGEASHDDGSPYFGLNWIAAVAGTDEGTYAIGISDYDLKRPCSEWSGRVQAVRLGGPEMFPLYEERYGSQATAPMR